MTKNEKMYNITNYFKDFQNHLHLLMQESIYMQLSCLRLKYHSRCVFHSFLIGDMLNFNPIVLISSKST